MAQPPRPERVAPATAPAAGPLPAPAGSYVDWPAIFGGAAIGTTVAFILTTFGTAIGLSLVSPFEGEGVAPLGVLIALAIWVVWVAVSSAMSGAYVAGRMRRRVADATAHEVGVRDGLHGLIVWAVGTLIGATVVAATVGATARVGVEAASAAAEAVPGEVLASTYEYAAESLLRAPDREPAADLAEIREAVVRIFRAGTEAEAGVPEEDRRYLAQLVASRTGLTEEEANARVGAAIEQLQAAEQEAREAADAARKAAIVSAFVVAASLLIAAGGAFWAAGVGGRHRDEETVLPFFARWN